MEWIPTISSFSRIFISARNPLTYKNLREAGETKVCLRHLEVKVGKEKIIL